MIDIYASVDAFRTHAYERASEDLLAGHLSEVYGIEVAALSQLDCGVFRVDRRDGDPWVARVFPRRRPVAAAEGDAEILRLVERHGFPAERCMPEPVSVLDGSAVLVTELVPGANARMDRDPSFFEQLGKLLADLHSLPVDSDAAGRPAGSWHSLSIEGGDRKSDIAALLSLLADARTRASRRDVKQLDRLCTELASLDVGHGLPTALTHPDFVSANVIKTADRGAVLVDWTGAGTAPRISALGFLLASTGGDQELIESVVRGYSAGVALTDEELDRMPDSVRVFPLVLDCWSVFYRGAPPAAVASKLDASRRYGDTIAERTRRVLLNLE